jgi:hypothetical protein
VGFEAEKFNVVLGGEGIGTVFDDVLGSGGSGKVEKDWKGGGELHPEEGFAGGGEDGGPDDALLAGIDGFARGVGHLVGLVVSVMDLEPEDPEGGGDVALWEEVHEISEVGEDDVDGKVADHVLGEFESGVGVGGLVDGDTKEDGVAVGVDHREALGKAWT